MNVSREQVSAECSPINGTPVSYAFTQRVKEHVKEGQKDCTRQSLRGLCETVSSGHGRASAPMNSQKLWLPAQELHKIKPLNIPAWIEEST